MNTCKIARLVKAILCSTFLLCSACTVVAQGNVGINTTTPQAMLHVRDSSVLFDGTGVAGMPGPPPAEGPGIRMMWYADKAALRSGRVLGAQWDRDSVGLYSLAAGSSPKAWGTASTALGISTNAGGDYAVALGNRSSASGESSSAFGYKTVSSAFASTAMGSLSMATMPYTTAMGFGTLASEYYATAIGRSTTASGYYSIAMGYSTTASGVTSTALGYFTQAMGERSLAGGTNTVSKGVSSVSMGRGTQANGYGSLVIGEYNDTLVTQENSPSSITPYFIIGNGSSDVSRSNAMVVRRDGHVGIGTSMPNARLHVEEGSVLFKGSDFPPDGMYGDPPATGMGVRMMWYEDKAAFRAGFVEGAHWDKDSIGIHSFATGYSTRASGSTSTALGAYTRASGSDALATGNGTLASGNGSTATGIFTTASAEGSTAIGHYSYASGIYSLAAGDGTVANGVAATAFGSNTTASGASAFAAGEEAVASGEISMAFGANSKAIGLICTAMGGLTTASGDYSTALNYGTIAKGGRSTAIGHTVQANGYASLVLGQFNDTLVASQSSISSSTPLLIIGNGNSSNSRSNALVVRKDGRVGIHVNAPAQDISIFDVDNDGDALIELTAMGGGMKEMILGLNESVGGLFGTVTNTSLTLRTNNSTRMTITGTGNAGIGTSTPANRLDVEGALAIGTSYSGSSAAPSNGAIIQGSVGIGTSSPDRKLDVSGSNYQAIRITSSNTSRAALEIMRTPGGSDWRIIDSTGLLYFGQSNDDFASINEVVRLGGSTLAPASDDFVGLGTSGLRWTAVYAVNGTIQTSDATDKESVSDLSSGLDAVLRLRPVTYSWKNALIDHKKQHAGFLAQDLLDVFPSAVATHEWKEGPEGIGRVWARTEKLGVIYSELIPLLTKAIQEQQQMIADQQQTIDSQEAIIKDLDSRIGQIEHILKKSMGPMTQERDINGSHTGQR